MYRLLQRLLYASLIMMSVSQSPGFPSTAFAQEKYAAYITALYDQGDKDIRNYLLDEIHHFLRWYPEVEQSADMMRLIGAIHQDQGNESLAAVSWLKCIMLYPQSAAASKAREALRARIITNRHFNERRPAYLEALDADPPTGPLEQRWYQYLLKIERIDDPDTYAFCVEETRELLNRYPEFEFSDHVVLNMAQAYDRQKKDKEAVYTYRKVEGLYPESQFVPYARLRQGTLYFRQLNKRDEALSILDALITQFPGNDYAPEAQFLTGEIKAEKFRDWQGAVDRYLQMHRAYPNSPLTVTALFRAAEICDRELKDYIQSIEILQLIADVYTTQPEADRSLERAARVYEERLKDYNNAIGLRVRMVQLFPESPHTVNNLMEAARLAETELKDYRRASEIYQIVAKDYPLSNRAKDAVKNIQSLEKKLTVQ